jgi:hypothetical protein
MALMIGIPMIAWANFGLWLEGATRVVGWTLYAVGIVLYYTAAVEYARDARRALAARSV